MKEITKEWFAKSRSDLDSAKILLEAKLYDQSCFHSQQAVEKLLKAFLIEHDKETSKTHDLRKLLEDCSKIDFEFIKWSQDANLLSSYAVHVRYPGEHANEKDAKDSFSAAKSIMEFISNKI